MPLGDLPLTSPEAIEKIGAVHRAVANVEGVGTPLSLWSLVEWLGGDLNPQTLGAGPDLIDDLPPASRQRFYGKDGGTLVSVNIGRGADRRDRSADRPHRSGGQGRRRPGCHRYRRDGHHRPRGDPDHRQPQLQPDGRCRVRPSGHSDRLPQLADRRHLDHPERPAAACTGGFLFLLGRGLQFNGVLALTVAFGIAVDGTIHYLNHFLRSDGDSLALKERLVWTSRTIGPQLFGTTAVIVTGLAATQTSEMPTVALFGMLAAVTLVIGLVGDLIVLPALMAGVAKRWFTKDPIMQPVARGAA